MRYLILIVITIAWSLGLFGFLLINPVVQGSGDPTPPLLTTFSR
nr:hypothetical protein [uncultured Rhodopila sp.]